MNCGAVGAACCPGDICQSGGECVNGAGASMMCAACGGAGQACCGGGTAPAAPGSRCVDPGAGPAACTACGALGQPCCGSGTVTTGTCNTNLACANVQGIGVVCIMPPPT